MHQAIGLRRPIPFHPPRPHPAAVNVEAIQEHTEVIGQTPELEIPVPQSKRGGKGKGKTKGVGNFSGKRVSQRGKSFSKDENKIICSAFLNVSKDPITGTNQSSGGYYQRIHKYFVENIEGPSTRSQVAISNRWLTIQKAVNKFCVHFLFVERLDKSGKTEQDRIDDAVKLYEESEPWTLMHCWNILRHEAKWSDKMVEINSGGTSTKVNQQVAGNNQGEQGQSEHDDNG